MSIYTKKKGRGNQLRLQYVERNPFAIKDSSVGARTIEHKVVNPRLVVKQLANKYKDIVYVVKVVPDDLEMVEQRKLENLKFRGLQFYNYDGVVIMARNKVNADRKAVNSRLI